MQFISGSNSTADGSSSGTRMKVEQIGFGRDCLSKEPPEKNLNVALGISMEWMIPWAK